MVEQADARDLKSPAAAVAGLEKKPYSPQKGRTGRIWFTAFRQGSYRALPEAFATLDAVIKYFWIVSDCGFQFQVRYYAEKAAGCPALRIRQVCSPRVPSPQT